MGRQRRKGDGDATSRRDRVAALHAPNDLAAALDDPSLEVARVAIRRLTELGGARAVDELRGRLLSTDLALTVDIASALQRLGDKQAVNVALTGIGAQPYTRRLASARALGALRDPRAVDALRSALNDEVAGVRAAALEALAQLGPTASAGAAVHCARLLNDPIVHVRIAAVRTITRIMPRPGAAISKAAFDPDWTVRREVAEHLAGVDQPSALALLGDPEPTVRKAAARTAGPNQLTRVAEMLTTDSDSRVRRAAVRALGAMGSAQALDAVINGLEDHDALVRRAALRALRELLGSQGAIDRLEIELSATRPQRRRYCLYALAQLNAHPPIFQLLVLVHDPAPDVRLALIETADVLLAEPNPLIVQLAADSDPAVYNAATMWLLRGGRREPGR